MEHAAIVAGLVLPDASLLFQHSHGHLGPQAQQFMCCGQPHDAAPGNDNLPLPHDGCAEAASVGLDTIKMLVAANEERAIGGRI